MSPADILIHVKPPSRHIGTMLACRDTVLGLLAAPPGHDASQGSVSRSEDAFASVSEIPVR